MIAAARGRAATFPVVTKAVRLLAFAGARDVLGAAEMEFSVEAPCTAAELLDLVCARYPALAPYKKALRLAVNGSYVSWADTIAIGDEVALIPPVAGG